MPFTADWLKNSYLLHQPQIAPEASQEQDIRRAAVLVTLLEGPKGLELLFTERAAHLRHHPGQISFPGGRLEYNETSQQAALREAEEEIGLPPSHVELLGMLPPQLTSTGFIIEPWLALAKPPANWQLQSDEVADLFQAPLVELWPDAHWQQWPWQHNGKMSPVYFLQWQQKLIWGATAAILYRLKQQLGFPPLS